MKPINYMSDQANDYSKALGAAKTLNSLRALLDDYHTIAADACAAAPQDEEEFAEFFAGLLKERKGKFAGEAFAQKYGAVLMPEIMFRVGMIANKFGAPWGLAFLRAKEVGRIVFDDAGVAHWVEPPNAQAVGPRSGPTRAEGCAAGGEEG